MRGEEGARMQLTINAEEKQGVAVLGLDGRVVLGEECESLRSKIKGLLANKQTNIILNLENVSRIDSTGIGALVESVILSAREGGRLKLVKVPRLINNILSTHRLLQAFEICGSEEEALASFQK
jgi:anti-sigma B factor antagonist